MAKVTKKKGVIVFKKGDKLKVAYAHWDAQPDGLGEKVVKMCRQLGLDGLDRLYESMILVDEEQPMTPEQIEGYRPFLPEKVRDMEDLTWSKTLMYTKDPTKALLAGYPYVVDYSGFCGAWRNRWRYLIDLDNNQFIVVKAGLEMLSQQDDEYFKDADYADKVAHTRVGTFPLDAIPEDWAQQCADFWKRAMILAVDYTHNKAAVESEDVQAAANGDRDYQRIKFFYGDNNYQSLFDDMD